MGTRGRVKSLTNLAKTRQKNKQALLRGKKPTLGGKKVSAKTFAAKTGETKASIEKAAGGAAKAKKKVAKAVRTDSAKAALADKLVKGKPGAHVAKGAFAKKFDKKEGKKAKAPSRRKKGK